MRSFTVPIREIPTESMRLTIELLDEIQREYTIDSIAYISSLSMGGFGTFELIERFPNKFAVAVPICGGGDATQAFLLKDLPIWVFHGAEDEIVPPGFSAQWSMLFKLRAGHLDTPNIPMRDIYFLPQSLLI